MAQIRLPCHSSGTNGAGGARSEDQPHGQLAGRLGGDRSVAPEDLVGPLEGPGDEPAVDGRADLVQAEREPGDDAEVAAAAAERPEQVGVLVAVGGADLAVRGDDLDLLEVVDRPAEAARQVAEAAAEGQAGDADLGDEAEHGRQPVLLRRPVDVLEQAPRPDVRELGVGIDRDVAHAGHVERQAALGDRGSGDVVAAALDAEQQPVVAREPHRRGDVVRRGRLEDERRDSWPTMPFQISTASSQPSSPGAQQRTLDPRASVVELLRRQVDAPALESGDVDGAHGHVAAPCLLDGSSASRSARRKASGCSRGGSSAQFSITCSGHP